MKKKKEEKRPINTLKMFLHHERKCEKLCEKYLAVRIAFVLALVNLFCTFDFIHGAYL